MATPSLELGRLFSLMEVRAVSWKGTVPIPGEPGPPPPHPHNAQGVDPEGLFNAALLRAAGGELGAAGLPTQLTPRLQTGLEGLEERGAGRQADGSPSGDMDGNGSTDDEDDKNSMGGLGGGPPAIPPRTGCINDRKCTKVGAKAAASLATREITRCQRLPVPPLPPTPPGKPCTPRNRRAAFFPTVQVLPASSSAPKYKFVVPNEYVYKFMKHLVERPFHMRDMGGKLWECVLIQRKNKVGAGGGWSTAEQRCSAGCSALGSPPRFRHPPLPATRPRWLPC